LSTSNIDKPLEQTTETRCLHCLEPIAPGARRCPHCLSWQRRWAGDSQNPLLELIVVAVGLLVVAAVIVLWLASGPQELPPERTAAELAELVVSDAEILAPEGGDRSFVAVLGRVENHGQSTWRNLYFRVDLLDSDGRLVDTFNGRAYSLVLEPGAEQPFKVADYAPIHDLDAYDGCRVEVTWAQRVE
jgi:hypothetical protein